MQKPQTLEVAGVTYELEPRLGAGGGGEVWRARSSDDGRLYALKRIRKSRRDSDQNQRFRHEIAFGLASENDHVVKIHGHSETTDEFAYVMDLYPSSLRQVIDLEFDYPTLLDYLSQLCEALVYVHAAGIVHRDVKPENILIDDDRSLLVLADFGIAHFKNSVVTKHRDLLANRNYLAPEQMIGRDAREVAAPADVFALGIIMTEVFTKDNSRGGGHRRVRDSYPVLADLDDLIKAMTLQDPADRPRIAAVRDALEVIRRRVASRILEITDDLRDRAPAGALRSHNAEAILGRAGSDILAAKYIFERATREDFSRYNLDYHAEIAFDVGSELYNACFHSKLYSMCKAQFESEATGWSAVDSPLTSEPHERGLVAEFVAIQNRYPLPGGSVWKRLPALASHYFRFCKGYHGRELLDRAVRMESESGPGSFGYGLRNAPILWLVETIGRHLATDAFDLGPSNSARVEFESHVRINWATSRLDDPSRVALGRDLFNIAPEDEPVRDVIVELEKNWDVTTARTQDGGYTVHFRTRAEYSRFRSQALAMSSPYDLFAADTLDLLRPEEEYDELIVFVWEPIFEIPHTLAMLLGLRDIAEKPISPA